MVRGPSNFIRSIYRPTDIPKDTPSRSKGRLVRNIIKGLGFLDFYTRQISVCISSTKACCNCINLPTPFFPEIGDFGFQGFLLVVGGGRLGPGLLPFGVNFLSKRSRGLFRMKVQK